MNYNDYLQTKISKHPEEEMKTYRTVSPISSLDEYLRTRERCEQFEDKDITEYLTKEDYEAFEANFERIMEQFNWKDPDPRCEGDETEFDIIERHMRCTGWAWARCIRNGKPTNPTVKELQEEVRYLFTKCLKKGKAYACIGTGGFTVSTDIHNHKVSVTFNVSDLSADDIENSVY